MVINSSVVVHNAWPVFTKGNDKHGRYSMNCIIKVFSGSLHFVAISQNVSSNIRYKVTIKIRSELALVCEHFHSQKSCNINEQEHDDENICKIDN